MLSRRHRRDCKQREDDQGKKYQNAAGQQQNFAEQVGFHQVIPEHIASLSQSS